MAETEKKWYVIHTYSGFEHKVKESLEQKIVDENLQDLISRVLIPTEEVIEVRKGKRQVVTKKTLPGYVLVYMKLTDETYHIVKNIPKVTGFVGGTNPPPLSDQEVNKILEQIEAGRTKPKPKVMFHVGEKVRVIDGPFTNFTGVVDEVNVDKNKLKVMVSIFGRPTPVELEFLQVEAI